MICEFSLFRLACLRVFIAVKMSSNTQRTSKDRPRSLKCRHFCLPFDNHNYCPSCREANRDDPCVESPCDICSGFSVEQMQKIKNRSSMLGNRKQTLQKKMNLICWAGTWSPLLDLRQTLSVCFSTMSSAPAFEVIVPPTPGTALQQKIESKFEKSLGS